MSQATRARILKTALWLVLVVILAASIAGCGDDKKQEPKEASGSTAKGSYELAKSKLSTTAPDAKLLVVQTASSVTSTGTPVWAYLFGSPKSDTIYIVYVNEGKAMPAQQYGSAGLSADEWKQVPAGIGEWKIDSDEAYRKALEASGAEGEPAQWVMGLVTYIPKSSTADNVEAFKWNVNFDPGTSGATTGTIEVDAKTGEVSKPAK